MPENKLLKLLSLNYNIFSYYDLKTSGKQIIEFIIGKSK